MPGFIRLWAAPALVGALAGAGAAFAFSHETAPANEVYALNVAHVINAERYILSKGEAGGKGGLASAETQLFRVNHTMRQVVSSLAGNHLVVVKQAIVSGPYKNITPAVMRALGLPANAPKADLQKMLAEAPAMGYAPLSQYLGHQRAANEAKGRQLVQKLQQERTQAVLP